MKYVFAFIMTAIISLISATTVFAGVGDIRDCQTLTISDTDTYTGFSISLASTTEYTVGQTFLALSTFRIGAVKVKLLRDTGYSGGGTITVRIYPTTFNGVTDVPYYSGGVIATATVNANDLYEQPDLLNTFTGDLDCNYSNAKGIIAEFSTNPILTAGTTYAIVMSNGPAGGVAYASVPTSTGTGYALGEFLYVVPLDDPSDPNDWSAFGVTDMEFVIYDENLNGDVGGGAIGSDIDDWFDDWLAKIGATDITTKMLVMGAIAVGIIVSTWLFGVVGIIGAVLAFIFAMGITIDGVISGQNYIDIGAAITGMLIISFAGLIGFVLYRARTN